jgi:crossover junction endodeoxyribonuclease RuvC
MQNKIIAVDPGYDRIGIAVFEGTTLLHSECFVPPKGEFPDRLLALHTHLTSVIKKFKPESLALETLFFSKNQKTAIKVAEARGVIQLTAIASGVPIVEYSPQAVKIAVTGSGNAEKSAVMRMIEKLVILPKKKRVDDEYDAIALGIAHTSSINTFLRRK